MSPYKYAGSQEVMVVYKMLMNVNIAYGNLWLTVVVVGAEAPPTCRSNPLFVRSSQAKESGLKGKEFKLGVFQIEDELRVCTKKYKIKKRIILN